MDSENEYQRTSAEEWVSVMRQVVPFFAMILQTGPDNITEVTSDGFASFKFVSPAGEELTITYDDGTYHELVSNNQ